MGEEEREREGEEEVVAKAAHEGEPGRPGSANGSGPRRRPAPLVRHTASSDINSIVGVSSVAVRKPEAILTYSKIVRSYSGITGYKSRSYDIMWYSGIWYRNHVGRNARNKGRIQKMQKLHGVLPSTTLHAPWSSSRCRLQQVRKVPR